MVILKTHAEIKDRQVADSFRQTMISRVVDELMSGDRNRLEKMIRDITEEHVKLTGTDGFYHNGRVFTNMQGVPFKNLQKQPIEGSLKDRIMEYSRQCKDFDADRAKMAQGLAVLLRNARSDQDVRDAIPDVLCAVAPPHIGTLSRTRPEMHTLTTKVHRNQYEKTMDRVFFYLGSRLLG